MSNAETNARKFDQKAIDSWVRYSKTENLDDKAKAEWFDKAAAKHWAMVPAVEAVPAAKVEKARCSHYKAIQTFYAIARDAGLDISKTARPKMRHAMETMMGRCVNSRSEVTGAEWGMMGAAIKAGKMAW